MKGTMNVNEIITAKIVEALASGKTAPWQRPWNISGMRNAVSKKLYRGINIFMLTILGGDNYFLTYNQARQLGGSVKKGEKGIPIVFFSRIESKTKVDKKGNPAMIGVYKYYTVFGINQCEGLKWTRPETKALDFEPIQLAEDLLLLGELHGAPISYGGDSAHYIPATHRIQMPLKTSFASPAHFYATAFHEEGHALHKVTESEQLSASFGSELYSKEELVAEIFSSFCLNHCSLLSENLFDNSTSYLASWRRKLIAEPNLIISAASKAQRRFDKLLGVTFGTTDETPATEQS